MTASCNRLIIAASEKCADLKYQTGFSAPDSFLWFQTENRNAALFSSLEYGRASKQCRPEVTAVPIPQLRQWLGLPEDRDAASALNRFSMQVKTISEATGVTSWRVPPDFPLEIAEQLAEMGIQVKTLRPFAPERQIKSAAEIEAIGKAQRIAEAGLAAADEMLRRAETAPDGTLMLDGAILTAERLRATVENTIASLGGSATGTITAPGPQGADPHQQGEGPIRAGEPIVIDIFPSDSSTGYFGDLTRTRVKGTASDTVRKAYQCVLNAQKTALENIMPGKICADIHNMVADYFKAQGYETGFSEEQKAYHGFFHGLGHSLGLEIHESPSLSPACKEPLRPGHVVTVEPGLYYPEWGGIRIEDTVAVTENGIRNLTTAPHFLEIP
ncbi:MAG: aminopeptidase P family protein [Victivallales bacterium]|nr:aminopeptidase P family protein [Victivallales bacterium]